MRTQNNNHNKMYFKNDESEFCHPFNYHLKESIEEAKERGEDTFTLIEAINDNDNPNYIFCSHKDIFAVGERDQCKKHICSYYESKSGRGVCKHRGKLYETGEEVTFKLSDYEN